MSGRPKTPDPEAKQPTFEERLAALEQVVRDLEGEGLSLEQAIARYRQGVEHLKACRALLDDAEQRLVELVEEGGTDDEGGPRVSERPLKVTERGLEPDDRPEA